MKLALSNSVKNRGGEEAAFTPASISSLVRWYKFDTDIYEDAGGTDAVEDGDDVYVWKDQVGTNHATSSANYFDYDSATGGVESGSGANSQLYIPQLNFSGEFAMYIRASSSTLTAGGHDLFFYDKESSTVDFFRLQTTTEVKIRIAGDTAQKWAQATQVMDQFYNYGWERDGSNNMYVYRDGSALTATTGISNTSTLDIDAIGGNFDGIIKEIIICDEVLSSSDRTNLETYLGNLTQGE